MGTAIVTVKIMPESPEVNLEDIETKAKEFITGFAGEGETKSAVEPVAFGLKSLSITFVMDEDKGSPDVVAEKIQDIDGVQSAEISDVRRAIG